VREVKERNPYNRVQWIRVRDWKLSRNPLCEWCQNKGQATWATVVHHTNENPWDNRIDNLVALCRQCHEDHHGRIVSTACDVDGVPANNKHHWNQADNHEKKARTGAGQISGGAKSLNRAGNPRGRFRVKILGG
jgi:hypothetical protein